MPKVDKLYTSRKKTARTQKNKKITSSNAAPDMFSRLCRSCLGVECVREYRFHPVRRWRFDYAIPAALVALEVEGGVWSGGRHVNPKGFLGDMEKYNTATLMGWSVLRTTPDKLLTSATIEMLKCAIYGRNMTKSNQNNTKK